MSNNNRYLFKRRKFLTRFLPLLFTVPTVQLVDVIVRNKYQKAEATGLIPAVIQKCYFYASRPNSAVIGVALMLYNGYREEINGFILCKVFGIKDNSYHESLLVSYPIGGITLDAGETKTFYVPMDKLTAKYPQIRGKQIYISATTAKNRQETRDSIYVD